MDLSRQVTALAKRAPKTWRNTNYSPIQYRWQKKKYSIHAYNQITPLSDQVLVSTSYGEWRLVESRISAMVARRAPFEPFATNAKLFAENYAYHLGHVTHVYVLNQHTLNQDDVYRIISLAIPSA